MLLFFFFLKAISSFLVPHGHLFQKQRNNRILLWRQQVAGKRIGTILVMPLRGDGMESKAGVDKLSGAGAAVDG